MTGTEKYSFMARVPDHPGALQRAVLVISGNGGNINRIQFDRRIDPTTVFFEVSSTPAAWEAIASGLRKMGYLQADLRPKRTLKISVHIPHVPGALAEFLNYTTAHRANINLIDFDDRGSKPNLLTVGLNLEDEEEIGQLLDELKSRYRIEVDEYETDGHYLDDTVFYLRFAQSLREIIGGAEDSFLLSLLGDINHVAQELMNRGQDPHVVFESVRKTGETLKRTHGPGFYADVQRVPLADDLVLLCIQPPCGGSVFLLDSPAECVMVDTGYGIYAHDMQWLVQKIAPGALGRLTRIIITHADADHCGGGGFYDVPAFMHPGTREIILVSNRAYGSRNQASVLEEVYTSLINLFSRFTPPLSPVLFPAGRKGMRGPFPILDTCTVGRHSFEVLEGLGGHLYGQVYLFSPDLGVFFAADTLINMDFLTPERAEYNSLAVNLVTSVNVDSEKAREERGAIVEIARAISGPFSHGRVRCLLCGGHGPVSVLRDGRLVPAVPCERIAAGGVSGHP
ncbi:MAG: MBL fold metallo-hydrolase [Methanolinea sp.]|nr:MBL fold metallo-hydrolase [Methanolinea sp.]